MKRKGWINYIFSKKINSDILIDIGANIGFYSILSSGRFGQIYSFEPNDRNFKLLKKNIKKNKLNNIQVLNFGLGEKEEKHSNSNTKGELLQTSGFAISKK